MATNEVSRNRPEVLFSLRINQCRVILKRVWRRVRLVLLEDVHRSGRSWISVDGLRRQSPPGMLTVPTSTGKKENGHLSCALTLPLQ